MTKRTTKTTTKSKKKKNEERTTKCKLTRIIKGRQKERKNDKI